MPTTAGPWKLVQSMSDMLVGDDRRATAERPPAPAKADRVTVVGDDGSDIAHVTPEPGKTDDVKLMGLAPELLEVVQGLMANDIETVGKSRERAAEILGTAGPCLVNAGGDIATRAGTWTVAVETATEPLTLALAGNSALASSGRYLRRWRRAGRELHHLIDPATWLPARTDVIQATVLADTARAAEALAKVAVLAGSDRAPELLDRPGVVGTVMLTDRGEIRATPGMLRWLA